MSGARIVGLGGLLARKNAPYAFVSAARMRSSKSGESGVLDDKEKASENIFIRKHEEEEMKNRQYEAERKKKEEAKKKKEESK